MTTEFSYLFLSLSVVDIVARAVVVVGNNFSGVWTRTFS